MTPDFNNIDRDVEPVVAPCRCKAAHAAYCWDVAHRKLHEWDEAGAAWWILCALNGSEHANAMTPLERARERHARRRWEIAGQQNPDWSQLGEFPMPGREPVAGWL